MRVSLSSFEPDESVQEITNTLKREGGVILQNLAPPDLLDSVYEEIQENVPEAAQKSSTHLWPDGNRTVGARAAVSSIFAEELLIHPKVLEIVDAMLLPKRTMALQPVDDASNSPQADRPTVGDGLWAITENEQKSSQLVWQVSDPDRGPNCDHYNLGASVMLEVREGNENQVLHRENAIYQPYIGYIPKMREFVVSVMWAATDFSEENGATRLVPGSHTWSEDRIAKENEIAQAVMPKGSAVMWLSRTLHGAGKSRLSERRTGFFHSFIPDWLRQEENQYLSIPPEIAEKLSGRAKQVIGYSSSNSLGWVKGRAKENLLVEGSGAPI
ncbi:MAG: phytanoyl-CoA dioxygenase family protein [Pseudomonadota bacterium]|nr:phytanoyl-CoA dioxygenase family protein [Pseudomonadota bacterium]